MRICTFKNLKMQLLFVHILNWLCYLAMAFVATSSISSTHITAKKIQKHCPPNGFTEEVKFPTDPSNNMFSYVSTKGRV